MKRFCGIVMLLLLTGCVAYGGPYTYGTGPSGTPLRTTSLEEANSQVGEQAPVEYRVGFMQGCDSGRFSEGDKTFQHRKDEKRYGEDTLYRQGWDFGYIQCKNQMQGRAYYAGPYYGYPSYGYYPGWNVYPQFSLGFSHNFGYRPYGYGGFYRFHPYRR